MLSVISGFKTFKLLKMALLGQIFYNFLNFYYIKSAFSGEILPANGLCQVIYLLKKSTFHFMKLLIAVDGKFENDT
jgi:hypothetical protein